MKLTKIAQICKKHTEITVIRANGAQWFCIGPAAYAAYGLPVLRSADEVLAVMDVPVEKREAFQVSFISGDGLDHFADACEGEACLRDAGYSFMQRGRMLRPLYDEGGIAWWVNEHYLAPIDETNDITYWLRPAPGGIYDIAVKKGFAVIALISIRLPNTELEESAHEILTGTALGWRKGYRLPREEVDRMGGLQMMVYIGDTEEAEESDEVYEQEELA